MKLKGISVAISAIAVLSFFAPKVTVAADVDPIVIKGSKFFYKSNGTEFYIKGVAYQEDFSSNGTIDGATTYKDPLANEEACKRDIPLLQQLSTNTIRVYAADPKADHTQCMQLLQEAGIYVILDLGEPATSINRDSPEWNLELYNRYTSVVDAFQQYSNILGFFAGNEVSNAPNNTMASVFVKAAVRDIKAYIKQKNYRSIGVGYATNDDDQRTNLANYFNCGPPEDSIDFWGYNIYSWCGHSDPKSSKYEERTQEFSSYNVPAFFAEYGCNKVTPRKFEEVSALYGSDMSQVWSGGIVYMYFQETNDFGLVTVGSDNKATKLPDFAVYSSKIAQVTPSGVESAKYSPTNSAQACPTIGSTWDAVDTLPPQPNEAICDCMVKNLTCTAANELSDDDTKKQLDYVCDPGLGQYCSGITANGSDGVYGAFSMCTAVQRLSWAFNTYYLNQTANNPANDNPCDFKGTAVKQTPKSDSACNAAVSQAGPSGTGVITSAPSGTDTGSSSPTHKSAAGLVTIPTFDFGMLQLGTYLVFAALAGAGMILL